MWSEVLYKTFITIMCVIVFCIGTFIWLDFVLLDISGDYRRCVADDATRPSFWRLECMFGNETRTQ